MNQFSNENLDDSAGFKDVLAQYFIHYKWFVVSVLIFFI